LYVVVILRKNDIRWTRIVSGFLLLLLLVSVSRFSPAEMVVYDLSLVETDRSLPPTGSGGPLQFYMNWDGTKMLRHGYGTEDELRVVDMDLETLAILDEPASGFDLKECSLTLSGEYALAWGSVAGEVNDTLVVYNLTTYAIEPDFISNSTLNITSIDHANLLGNDQILGVTGRDALGTSRFIMMELWTGTILLDDEIYGNTSVTEIVNTDNMMVLLCADGSLFRYSGRFWTISENIEIFPGPFTARSCGDDSMFLLGDGDGSIVAIQQEGEHQSMNISEPPTPIEALAFGGILTDENCYVSAVPGSGQGSVIRLWNVDHENWTLMNETDTGSAVTGLLSDPNEHAIFAAAFADGSLQFYRIEETERTIPDPPNPDAGGADFNFGDDVLPILAPILIVATIIFVVIYYRKKRNTE